jgi:hypothetical protein
MYGTMVYFDLHSPFLDLRGPPSAHLFVREGSSARLTYEK